jgi:hypothetical protein
MGLMKSLDYGRSFVLHGKGPKESEHDYNNHLYARMEGRLMLYRVTGDNRTLIFTTYLAGTHHGEYILEAWRREGPVDIYPSLPGIGTIAYAGNHLDQEIVPALRLVAGEDELAFFGRPFFTLDERTHEWLPAKEVSANPGPSAEGGWGPYQIHRSFLEMEDVEFDYIPVRRKVEVNASLVARFECPVTGNSHLRQVIEAPVQLANFVPRYSQGKELRAENVLSLALMPVPWVAPIPPSGTVQILKYIRVAALAIRVAKTPTPADRCDACLLADYLSGDPQAGPAWGIFGRDVVKFAKQDFACTILCH